MSRFTNSGSTTLVRSIDVKLEKISESIKKCLFRDGTTPNQMEAPIDMNGYSLLNLPEPTSQLSPVRLKDLVQDRAIVSDIVSNRREQGIFNIMDYGAVPDNSTDNRVAIDAAISALAAVGGGTLYIPAGKFRTSGNHAIHSNMSIRGEGNPSVIKRTSGSTNPLFTYIDSDTRPEITRFDILFQDVRFEGTFDETGEEGSGSLIVGVGLGRVRFSGCKFWYADAFVLNFNQCDTFDVSHCEFWYNCRDVIAVWGTPSMVVAHNIIVGNDDDSISLNQARFESTNDVIRDSLIVTGNYLRDTGAIKIQQAKNTVISHNVIKLCKGGGAIFIEGEASSGGETSYTSNAHNVLIDGNIIVDQMPRVLAFKPEIGSINERIGIKIDAMQRTVKEYEAGYQYNYTDSGASSERPITENHTIVVSNNIIRRTVQPDGVKTYSELYGFGKMFSRFKNTTQDTVVGYIDEEGFVDPVITEDMAKFLPMQVRDGLINSCIRDNYFQGSDDKCLWFDSFAWDASEVELSLRNITIERNTFRDFEKVGIDLSAYAETSQDIVIQDNVFDGDPYTRLPERNADGSWTSKLSCVGIQAVNQKGLRIKRNTFKNLSTPWSTGSVGVITFLRNVFEGQPSTTESPTDYAVTNKGLGLYPFSQDPEMELVYVDSDPTSPTYLEVLEKQVQIVGNTPPTTGYYFAGQFLFGRDITSANGTTLLGFRRATNGNTHVLGTDWIPFYALNSNAP